jgi:putative transposase
VAPIRTQPEDCRPIFGRHLVAGGTPRRHSTAQDRRVHRVSRRRYQQQILRSGREEGNDGPELACAAMTERARGHTGLHFIPPGEPWRYGYVESFNTRVRDECLNISTLSSLSQARVDIGDWNHDYNHDRRHCSPSYQPPARYAATCAHRWAIPAHRGPAHVGNTRPEELPR